MEHNKFQRYMLKIVDINLVSLSKNHYGACVLSKIFEYLSLNMPILGFIPPSDAYDIVNNNDYGIAANWGDLSSSRTSIIVIIKMKNLQKFRSNISKDVASWSMKTKILELHNLLLGLKN